MTTLNQILPQLKGVRKSGDGWVARCPSHDDKHASLSIREGSDGRLLLKCHSNSGCKFETIIASVSQANGTERREVAAYDYRDETDKVLYQAVRFEPKNFLQRRPDGAGGWEWKLNGVRRVLYRLPELLAANHSRTVLIVEGEKDCDRLVQFGLVATTNAGGAGKWRDEYNEALRGRKVVILPDNDEPGRKHAQQVAGSLRGVAESVKIVELPRLPEKGDVSDWLARGNGIKELRELAAATPLFAVKVERTEQTGLAIVKMADVEREEVEWLWCPYIAVGKLTLLEGDPGIGKSWITAALACAVSRGRGLPGIGAFEHGNVLMLSAEDGLGDTLRPRLDAVAADVSRVFALNQPLTFDEKGLLSLEEALIEYTPKLLTVDPLFAFTGGKVDIHRANECRTITARLALMAEKHGCAIVAVRHLGKSRGMGHALNAGIGSIDLVAAARSVLLAGKDPDDENKRAVTQIKSNLAPHGPSIGFTLRGGEFFWTGESDLTAERILSFAASESERPALDEACEFLRDELSEGECDVATLKANARRAGVSEVTLRRAKERLSVKVRKVGFTGKWVWGLPASEGYQAHCEGDQKAHDDHLRASNSDKSTCVNDLDEGDHGDDLDHLWGPTKEDLRRAALDPEEWRRLEREAEGQAISGRALETALEARTQ
jgi:putative DNA primase/helicase